MTKVEQQLEVVYEPGIPMDSRDEAEVQGADVQGEGVATDAVQGRDIPEFQRLGPILRDEETAEKVLIG